MTEIITKLKGSKRKIYDLKVQTLIHCETSEVWHVLKGESGMSELRFIHKWHFTQGSSLIKVPWDTERPYKVNSTSLSLLLVLVIGDNSTLEAELIQNVDVCIFTNSFLDYLTSSQSALKL